MNHLLQFTPDGRIQPHWRPGTPWRERMRLAKAFRAFVDGIDPRDRSGFYRFDIDEDGNAMVGSRVTVQRSVTEILLDTPPEVGPGFSIGFLP